MTAESHWSGIEERGVYWGMRFMLGVYSLLGKRVCLLLTYPVVFYFWLFNRAGRRASLQFLERIAHEAPDAGVRPTLWWSYLHFEEFAKAMVEKLAAWRGEIGIRDVVFHNRDRFVELLSRQEGALLLGSHLGNLEVSKALSVLRKGVRLNVLVHTRHAENFNRLINEVSDQGSMQLIQVTDLNPGTAVMLREKIEQGELLVLVGDRTPVENRQRTTNAEFLGRSAPFPQGPFILAALLKCPVYTLFCLNENGTHHIYFEFFSEHLRLPRNTRSEALAACVQGYADRLERYTKQAPLQWFNFYDFWYNPEG